MTHAPSRESSQSYEQERRSPSTLGRPALGVISFDESAGGVAYIARLLREALTSSLEDAPVLLSLDAKRPDAVARAEALRFSAKVGITGMTRRADWILFGHPGIARAVTMMPRRMRLPYAVQLHGTDAWERKPSEAVRQARLRIAPSQFTAEAATRAFPEIGPIAVCPHGLLPDVPSVKEPFDDAVLARVQLQSVAIIGRVSAAERYKGHDQLLECWPRVVDRVPDAQLVVVGDGDDRTRLAEKARTLGIGDRVLFTGYVSRGTREAILRRVKVFAMPSRGEGFGLVYLEAMRHGVPCVGSSDDAANESIVHGETGFLAAQRDIGAIAESISTLLTDEERRRRMGEAGQMRVRAHFTFEHYRARLIDLLTMHFGATAQG